MQTAAAVPREVRLGVDRTIRLGGNEVETPDRAVSQELRIGETARLQPVGVDRGVDVRAALAVGLVLVGHHDLPVRPYRRVAEVAAAGGRGDTLRRAERPERAEATD